MLHPFSQAPEQHRCLRQGQGQAEPFALPLEWGQRILSQGEGEPRTNILDLFTDPEPAQRGPDEDPHESAAEAEDGVANQVSGAAVADVVNQACFLM